MKKTACLLLAAVLLLSLWGCSFSGSGKEPIEFYYLRSTFVYGAEDGVITSETRESSGHGGDLQYLLSLYLRGPLDEKLVSPFPDCRIVEIRRDSKALRLTFDAAFAQLEDIDLTLACACLAKTCFGLSDAHQIKIDAEAPDGNSAFSITLNRDSLILEDNAISPQQTEPGEIH